MTDMHRMYQFNTDYQALRERILPHLGEAERHARHALHYLTEVEMAAREEDPDKQRPDEELARLVDTVRAHTLTVRRARDQAQEAQDRDTDLGLLVRSMIDAAKTWATVAEEARQEAEHYRPRDEQESQVYWGMVEADQGMGPIPEPKWRDLGWDSALVWAEHTTRQALSHDEYEDRLREVF